MYTPNVQMGKFIYLELMPLHGGYNLSSKIT